MKSLKSKIIGLSKKAWAVIACVLVLSLALSLDFAMAAGGDSSSTGGGGGTISSTYSWQWHVGDDGGSALGKPSSATDISALTSMLNSDGTKWWDYGSFHQTQDLRDLMSVAYNRCVDNYNAKYPNASEPCEPRIVAFGYAWTIGNQKNLCTSINFSTLKQDVTSLWHSVADTLTFKTPFDTEYRQDTAFFNSSDTLTYLATHDLTSNTIMKLVVIDQFTVDGGHGWVELNKKSANASITKDNNCYALDGAVYGVYDNEECINLVTTLTTNSDGYAKSSDLISGQYYVKEITPPKGYFIDKTVYSVRIKANETVGINGGVVYDYPANDPSFIKINKYDGEKTYSASNLPQGSASLKGAQFKVEYFDNTDKNTSGTAERTWYFETNEEGEAWLCLSSYKVSGDALYFDDGDVVYPVGTYRITEIKAPVGYINNDKYNETILVTRAGDFVVTDCSVNPDDGVRVAEQVFRGALQFQKKLDNDASAIANCAFRISLFDADGNVTESHIAVTNEAGIFDTELVDAHSNANDSAVSATGVVDSSKLDSTQGVWFLKGTKPDNSKNPLVYGTYLIEELPCAANEGKQLIEPTKFIVNKDGVKVNLGTFDDTELDIATIATDGIDKDKKVVADEGSVIRDTIQYFNATKNRTYTVQTALIDKTDGNKVIAQDSKPFTADTAYGKFVMNIAVDTTELAGHMLAFKNTVLCDGRILATHNYDLTDEDEEVTVVKSTIGTVAVDDTSNTNFVVKDTKVAVVDTVNYTNLLPNTEYEVTGKLMKIDADGNATVYVDANEKEVAATTKFTTTDEANGSVEVKFEFDATNINEETKLIAYETLFKAKEEIAKHEDPADENQIVTVTIPELKTTLVDSEDGNKKVVADDTSSVVDTVEYKGLQPGNEYVINGELVYKDSGEVVTDADGKAITATKTFTPQLANGEEKLTFDLGTYEMNADTELVACETLARVGKTVAEHKDLEDEAQTVIIVVPEFSTAIYDTQDGDNRAVRDHATSIEDAVNYRNFSIDGESYKFLGMLFDSETGLPVVTDEENDIKLLEFTNALIGALGLPSDVISTQLSNDNAIANASDESQETEKLRVVSEKVIDWEAVASVLDKYADTYAKCVTSSLEMMPDKAIGTVTMNYNFDSVNVDSENVVALTVAYKDDKVAAVNVSLDDKAETFKIVTSEIKTVATDKSDGNHNLKPSQDSVIIDTVTYTDLIPGQEYVLKATLMDKATGEPLSVGDRHVIAEVKFTPNSASGTQEVTIGEFDTTGLLGHQLVAFEELYKQQVVDGEVVTTLVAEHKDINDADQTVLVVDLPDGSSFDKTGADMMTLAIAAGVLGLAGIGFAVYAVRKRNQLKALMTDKIAESEEQ